MAGKAGAKGAGSQPPSEAELREVVLRGETLRQQLAALEGQRELLLELAGDARNALMALDHLASAKEGDETLVPLGAGAYVHARLHRPERAIASLGAGIHADLPVADARGRLQSRAENLDAATAQVSKDLQRVADELSRLNAFLEQVYGGG